MGDDDDGWIDSRYAWTVILLSTWCVAFVVMGVQYSAGVINSAVITEFDTDEGSAAWVTAFGIGFLLLSMGPAGNVQARIGQRATVFIGCFFTVLGLATSALATEIWHLYITFGLIASSGQGFCYLAAVSATQLWFSKKKVSPKLTATKSAMAMALGSSGSGFGTIILGVITENILDGDPQHDPKPFKVAFLTLAAISFFMIFIPAFFLNGPPAAPGSPKKKPDPPSWGEVMKSPGLKSFMLLLAVFGLGGWNPLVHSVEAAMDGGFSVKEATHSNSFAFGAGAIFGRPIAMEVLGRIGNRRGFPGVLMLMSICSYLYPVMSGNEGYLGSYGWICVNQLFYGVGFGAFISVLPPITAELTGMAKFPAAIGLVYASFGLTMMLGPPATGYWYDSLHDGQANVYPNRRGDYNGTYYVSGAVMTVSALLAVYLNTFDSALAAPPPKPKEDGPKTIENPVATENSSSVELDDGKMAVADCTDAGERGPADSYGEGEAVEAAYVQKV
jgi:MFS family permease